MYALALCMVEGVTGHLPFVADTIAPTLTVVPPTGSGPPWDGEPLIAIDDADEVLDGLQFDITGTLCVAAADTEVSVTLQDLVGDPHGDPVAAIVIKCGTNAQGHTRTLAIIVKTIGLVANNAMTKGVSLVSRCALPFWQAPAITPVVVPRRANASGNANAIAPIVKTCRASALNRATAITAVVKPLGAKGTSALGIGSVALGATQIQTTSQHASSVLLRGI